MRSIWFGPVGFPGSFTHCSTTLHDTVTQCFIAHHQLWVVFGKMVFEEVDSDLFLIVFVPPPQGFTYVAPSVLENVKEKFSFEHKVRSPRKFPGSPRTPVR